MFALPNVLDLKLPNPHWKYPVITQEYLLLYTIVNYTIVYYKLLQQ